MINMREQKTNQSLTPFELISRFRAELMGLAIISVVFLHTSQLNIRFHFKAITFMREFCYGGVDVFLFLSGLGIFCSLSKNSISKYIKNRIIKIVPTWWIYLIINVLISTFLLDKILSLGQILGFATFSGYFAGLDNQGNWYIYAIMLFYLVAPIFYSLLKDSKNKAKTCFILVLIAVLISFSFFNNYDLIIIFTRLPIFIIGMYFASNLNKGELRLKNWLISIILTLVGFGVLAICIHKFSNLMWDYGLYWYPFILITPNLLLIVSKLFSLIESKIKIVLVLLKYLGKSSLEILLAQILIFSIFSNSSENLNIIFKYLIFISVFPLGILFHMLTEYISGKLSKHI